MPDPKLDNIFADAINGRQHNSTKAYTRALRRKLYFLFAMLVVVLILMKEAAKPERWEWMGFDRASEKTSGDAIEVGLSELNSPAANTNETIAIENLDENGEAQSANIDFADTKQIELAPAFWKEAWQELETSQKVDLLTLIQRIRDSEFELPKGKTTLAETVIRLQTEHTKFIVKQREQIEYSNLTDDVKSQQRKRVEAFESNWLNNLEPALAGSAIGKDCTISQQRKVLQIIPELDRLILSDLQDFSSPKRIDDLAAWHRFWDRVLQNELKSDETESVSAVQLRTQPGIWRGKPVRLKGQLLGGKRTSVGDRSPLREQGHYYEWWIASNRNGSEVLCVYTSDKPEGMEVTNSFASFDTPVEVSGFFYKIRSYIDDLEKTNHCPLVIGNCLSPIGRQNLAATNQWQPTFGAFVPWLIGIAVLAFAIAMWINNADRKKIHSPGGEHLDSINAHLDSLSQNTDIKSISEQLEELK